MVSQFRHTKRYGPQQLGAVLNQFMCTCQWRTGTENACKGSKIKHRSIAVSIQNDACAYLNCWKCKMTRSHVHLCFHCLLSLAEETYTAHTYTYWCKVLPHQDWCQCQWPRNIHRDAWEGAYSQTHVLKLLLCLTMEYRTRVQAVPRHWQPI